MKRVTKHARKRLRQRNINKGRNGIAISAKKNGKSKFYFEGAFHDYLSLKSSAGKIIKVYNNDIYIYSKSSNNLITMYAVPKKYIPVEQYLIDEKKRYAIERSGMYFKRDCNIIQKNGIIIKGIIIKKIYDDKDRMIAIIVLDKQNNYHKISIDNIELIDLNKEAFNKRIK